jgi:hypothetical protein
MRGLGKCGVGGFTEELHGAGAEAPQGVKGQYAERISEACVVHAVVPALVSVPESCSVARGASCRTKVRSGEEIRALHRVKRMSGVPIGLQDFAQELNSGLPSVARGC